MKSLKTVLIACFITLFTWNAHAQQLNSTSIEELTNQHLPESIELLKDWLSIPNNGAIEEQVKQNVAYSKEAFESRGFSVNILPTQGPPLLLAEQVTNINKPTILFYMHADGQPVDANQWSQNDPYIPVLKAKNSKNGKWEEIDWVRLEDLCQSCLR